jgi:hypothetical protein
MYALNFTQMELLSLDDLGSIFVSILTVCRAFAGKRARNIRAVFALGEKGLKTVETSVRNRVIMISIDVRLCELYQQEQFIQVQDIGPT